MIESVKTGSVIISDKEKRWFGDVALSVLGRGGMSLHSFPEKYDRIEMRLVKAV